MTVRGRRCEVHGATRHLPGSGQDTLAVRRLCPEGCPDTECAAGNAPASVVTLSARGRRHTRVGASEDGFAGRRIRSTGRARMHE